MAGPAMEVATPVIGTRSRTSIHVIRTEIRMGTVVEVRCTEMGTHTLPVAYRHRPWGFNMLGIRGIFCYFTIALVLAGLISTHLVS